MINTTTPLVEKRQFSNGVNVNISTTNHQFSGNPFTALYVGVSGDIVLDMGDATQLTFKSVPIGMLQVFGTQIYKVGTTATNMIALS